MYKHNNIIYRKHVYRNFYGPRFTRCCSFPVPPATTTTPQHNFKSISTIYILHPTECPELPWGPLSALSVPMYHISRDVCCVLFSVSLIRVPNTWKSVHSHQHAEEEEWSRRYHVSIYLYLIIEHLFHPPQIANIKWFIIHSCFTWLFNVSPSSYYPPTTAYWSR